MNLQPKDNGGRAGGSKPPVQLTAEQHAALGLDVLHLNGRLKRREDLDIIIALRVPPHIEMSVSVKERAEAETALREVAVQAAGKQMILNAAKHPQTRLLPVIYTVPSVRHKVDLRVAYWEFIPEGEPGKWGNGMRYYPGQHPETGENDVG